MTRGLGHQIEGPNGVAKGLGMNEVLSSGARTEDEGLYPIQHHYWHDLMQKAVNAQSIQAKEANDDLATAEVTRAAAQAREAAKAAAKASSGEQPRRRRRSRG